MTLEAERTEDAGDTAPEDRQAQSERRAKSERRGKDRRLGNARINKAAPRRSLMKVCGALATSLSLSIFAIVFLATAIFLDETPWIALSVTGTAVVISVFAMMLGSIEQRLIEIRLELMMGNGGMRQADRRSGDRRGEAGRAEDPIVMPAATPVALGGLAGPGTTRRASDPQA